MNRLTRIAVAAWALALVPGAAFAAGNLASEPTEIAVDINGANLTFSENEFELETGKYYRWSLTSDGLEEVMIRAPDLFRNSWINQIIIDEREVHTSGSIYGIEFDDEGEVLIFFVPLRPGDYEFFAPGYEDRGLSGTFVVRGENIASQPTELNVDINGANLTFSETEFELETGKYYRWAINSDGLEEVMVQAPDLFRNSWINQIIIDEREVHTAGSIYGIEFDDEGEVLVFFVPLRPGNYDFFAPGYEDRGLSGTFIVR